MRRAYGLVFIGILFCLFSVNIAEFQTKIIGVGFLCAGAWIAYIKNAKKDFFKMFVFGIVVLFEQITNLFLAVIPQFCLTGSQTNLLKAVHSLLMLLLYTYFLIGAGESVYEDRKDALKKYASEVKIWQIMAIGSILVYVAALVFERGSILYIANLFGVLLQIYPAVKVWGFMKKR